ncbi:MAG TPA: nucleoside triphosphate pyrophosphohydrolase [Clostridia bacterium]|nr:nucleoside triphosphate pyrophosphohydrolase [Clostridia bacterium]
MKKKITIVGLGPGNENDLTLGALKALKGGNTILRTRQHGIVPFLQDEGISFTALDDIYEDSDTLEGVYSAMIERIIEKAQAAGEAVLGVPGHPMIGDRLVSELISRLDREEFEIDIVPGVSMGGAVTAITGDRPGPGGLKILMAPDLDINSIDTDTVTVVLDIDSPLGASDVKSCLLRAYPPDLEVYICKNDPDGKPWHRKVALSEVDKQWEYDYSTCLYIPPVELVGLEEFDFRDLVRVMEALRSPEGCPWDREQTHDSLRQYLLEETYEVLEALDLKDTEKMVEELGDVLLQVVFHGRIGSENGQFDIRDITTGICRKMIERHPHIFGDVKVENSEQVLDNWEKIKKKEKGLISHTQILKDIPPVLPALMRAYKVQKKAALVGFDWDRIEDAVDKLKEELMELKDAYEGGDRARIDEELGDLLFSAVNVARFLKVEPELSLKATIEKFIRRFEYIEKMAPLPLEQMSLKDMDFLWNEAKTASLKDF